MLPALVLLTDADCRITGLNGPARSLLGDCHGRSCCEALNVNGGQCPLGEDAAPDYLQVGTGSVHGVVGAVAVSRMDGQRVVVMQPRAVASRTTEELSPREREVLQLVGRGYTDRRVAESLGLQPGTVRTHVENLRRKLGVRTRAQAVARANALGVNDG